MQQRVYYIFLFIFILAGLGTGIFSILDAGDQDMVVLFLIILSAAGLAVSFLYPAWLAADSLIQPLLYLMAFALAARFGGLLLYLVPFDSSFFHVWFPLNDPGVWGFLLSGIGCMNLIIKIEGKSQKPGWLRFLSLIMPGLVVAAVIRKDLELWPLIYLGLIIGLMVYFIFRTGLMNRSDYKLFSAGMLVFVLLEYMRFTSEVLGLFQGIILAIAFQPVLVFIIIRGLSAAHQKKKAAVQ